MQDAKALSGYQDDIAEIKADLVEIKNKMAGIKEDLLLMKWMLGFVLTFQVAEFFKQFVH